MADRHHPDAELLELAAERNRLVELREPLRKKANKLSAEAEAKWKDMGAGSRDDPDVFEAYLALCTEIGLSTAEDEREAINNQIFPLDDKIRAVPAQTVAGLKVKLDLLRDNMPVDFVDDEPREDQDFNICLFNELADEIERLAAPSPIMTLFEKWDALRDHSDERGLSADEVARRCEATDVVMEEISKLPATNAVDFAAKLSCITHYGTYDDLGGDCASLGSALIREAAALCGHPEKVARVPRDHQAGGLS